MPSQHHRFETETQLSGRSLENCRLLPTSPLGGDAITRNLQSGRMPRLVYPACDDGRGEQARDNKKSNPILAGNVGRLLDERQHSPRAAYHEQQEESVEAVDESSVLLDNDDVRSRRGFLIHTPILMGSGGPEKGLGELQIAWRGDLKWARCNVLPYFGSALDINDYSGTFLIETMRES